MSGSTPAPDAPFSQPESAAQSADLTGQGVSTLPISSPRFWRRHFLTFLSITLTLACFAYVGAVSAATAQTPITGGAQNWTSTDGPRHSESDGSYTGDEVFTVTNGSGTCAPLATFAEAKHTRRGSQATLPAASGPHTAGGPNGNTVRWTAIGGIEEFLGADSDSDAIFQNEVINYEHRTSYDSLDLPAKSDEWKWDTTGTCVNCPNTGDEGWAEYLVRCRTEIKTIFNWTSFEDHADPLNPLVDEAGYSAIVKVYDHNGIKTDIDWGVSGGPTGVPETIFYSKDNTTTNYFVLKISDTPKYGRAWGTYTVNLTGKKHTDHAPPNAFPSVSVSSGVDTAWTKVTGLWMVPHCLNGASYPGGGTTSWAGTLDAELYAYLLTQPGYVPGVDCDGETADETAESNTGGTVAHTGETKPIPGANIPIGFTEGTSTLVVFSDGSYLYNESYSNDCSDNPRRCMTCVKRYDACGRLILSCCKGKESKTWPNGTVTETAIGDSECPVEDCTPPEPCE